MAHVETFEQHGAHRLIPTKYAAKSVLESLALPAQVVSDLTELDAATNERKLSERGQNAAIPPGELLYGVPEAHIVNAAFTHAAPSGGRFNDARRGAWYAGVELDTSVQEVAFHKRRFLREGRITERLSFDYADFLADFSGEFHSLSAAERKRCLRPAPVPECYGPSQALAHSLLYSGSIGIVYPSVRNQGGTCIACFRPALIFHPRRGKACRLTLAGGDEQIETQAIPIK
ncbi:MAG TPA: RES family NAD+ phosphorylase [Acidobacteriaceae bacterium]|jgi:RES domain-containing protein